MRTEATSPRKSQNRTVNTAGAFLVLPKSMDMGCWDECKAIHSPPSCLGCLPASSNLKICGGDSETHTAAGQSLAMGTCPRHYKLFPKPLYPMRYQGMSSDSIKCLWVQSYWQGTSTF